MNNELIEECLAVNPTEVNLYMLKAANDRILSLDDEAAEAYRSSLRFDRRPEIYLQLGIVEWQLGHRTQAMDALTASVCFNPSLLEEITDPVLRQNVLARLDAFERTTRSGTVAHIAIP